MNDLVKFLTEYSNTDSNVAKDTKELVIEAYNEEGDIIATYPRPEFAIQDFWEEEFREQDSDYDLVGFELIAEEFGGSYFRAFDEMKELI